jgi:hypothetical protein
LPDELACSRYRWLSKYIKNGFNFKQSGADIKLAKRLFLDGEKRSSKGMVSNLQPRKKKDEFSDIPFVKRELTYEEQC